MAEVEVKSNLPELKSHLSAIGRKFEVKTVRDATRRAASIFRKAVREKAPKLSGRLRRSIYVKRNKKSTKGKEFFTVGAYYKRFRKVNGVRAYKQVVNGRVEYFGAFYWKWVHEGHKIVPRGNVNNASVITTTVYRTRKDGTQYSRTYKRSTESLRSRRSAANGVVAPNRFFSAGFSVGKTEALQKFFASANADVEKYSKERTAR